TAHVDFEAVTRAAQNAHPNAQTSVMTSQGSFLEALGIAARCEALAAKLTGAARETHLAAYQRLTAPTEMGTLFKVVSVLPSSVRMTPGLAPWPSK
ncbi:MAG: class I SAM-dependent methyltransferase, partial [Mangrovicoccus sp.]